MLPLLSLASNRIFTSLLVKTKKSMGLIINGKEAFSDIVLDRKIESLASNCEEPQIESTAQRIKPLFRRERA